MAKPLPLALLVSPLLLLACGSPDDSGAPASGGTNADAGASSGGRANNGSGGKARGGAAASAGDDGVGGAGAGETSTEGGSAGATGSGGTVGQAGAETLPGGTTSEGGTTSAGGTTSEGGTTSVGGSSNGGSSNGGTNAGGTSDETAGANTGGAPDEPSVELVVDATAVVRPISPLIYGINPRFASCTDETARFALCRLGGTAWSSYNWENNASNAGKNGCFQNDGALGASDAPGATVTHLLQDAAEQSAATVLTLPLLDHVAADKLAGSAAPACSGDVQLTPDFLNTRFKQNQARKGAALSDPPVTTDASVSQDEFVSFVKNRAGSANVLFALDNQPELWSHDLTPLHPQATTYQEVVARNVEYAQMVREVWPEAGILGFGGYGYLAFVNLQGAPNAPADTEFFDYYLTEMSAAQTAAGERLIDYVDVHWYSEAVGDGQRVIVAGATPGLAEARMQAPRSLWDPSYSENSWVSQSRGGPIRLLPWLSGKIAAHYPQTKLAISEWSYGGEADISGAIAVADTLGIYGREGVELAALELMQADAAFALAGVAAFRNYDGAGAKFGDVAVAASSSDVESVSVYASREGTAADRVVVIAINRSNQDVAAELNVASSTAFTSAQVYALTGASAELGPATAITAGTPNHFKHLLPAQSVSVIVPAP